MLISLSLLPAGWSSGAHSVNAQGPVAASSAIVNTVAPPAVAVIRFAPIV